MRRYLLVAAVCALGPALGVALDQQRGVRVEIREREDPTARVVEEVELYRASYALVVGINAYQAGWPRLSNAVRDAGLVAQAIRSQGFDVTERSDLGAADLEQAFEEFFVLKGQDPESRLLVWFAGHGHSENGEGYLVPADAPLPSQAAGFRLKALSVRRFGEYARQARSKHVLAVFDSCFAGTVFRSARGAPPAAITRATTYPVRQFITSGEADQSVSDDGTFRTLFLRALSGEESRADANGDRYVTGDEMGLFLTDRLTNLTSNRQTPRYGKLMDADWDRGDFVFRVAGLATSSEPPSVPPVVRPDPRPAATVDQVALERTSYRFPEDGIPMNNAQVGPFCCTGNVVIVRSTDGNPVGYVYFFAWEGQAYNVGGDSIVPDFAILVSGPRQQGDTNSEQIQSRIAFSAGQLNPQSAWVQAGVLQYRATVLDFRLERGPDSNPYFRMGSIKVRIDVRLAS